MSDRANYKGYEAQPCPLCEYENGVFIEHCEMHKEIHALRLQLRGLQSMYDELAALQSKTLLQAQKATPNPLGWQMLANGHYPNLISREMVIDEGGARVGWSFDVYDCNTGDWDPEYHFALLGDDVRLFQRVEKSEKLPELPEYQRSVIDQILTEWSARYMPGSIEHRDAEIIRQWLRTEEIWQDAPDSEGWWLFDGHEWHGEYVREDGVTHEQFYADARNEGENYYHSGNLIFVESLGKAVQQPIYVRYSHKGESLSQRRQVGAYHGEPILGYIPTNHSWDNTLHTIDTLIGKWVKIPKIASKNKKII